MRWEPPRRRFLRATGGVVGGAGLLSAATRSAPAASDESWPQFGYDAANTGHAPDNTGPAGDVVEQWSVKTGNRILSSPAVVNGTVYVGSLDTQVYALSGSDGSEQWSFDTDGGIESSPAVRRGLVYIGSNDRKLYALSSTDGSEAWSFEAASEIHPSPTVTKDDVYMGSDFRKKFDRQNVFHKLTADFGVQIWSFESSHDVNTTPAVVDGTVYFGNGSDVHARSTSDGSKRWISETGGKVMSSPAVTNGTVYVGSNDSNVYALSASDGTTQWSFSTDNSIFTSPSIANGTVYVTSGSRLYALNAADGTEEWHFENEFLIGSSPAIVDGTVYIGTDDEYVYALNAADGSEQWRFETGGSVRRTPAVANGSVYVGSDQNIRALTTRPSTPTPSPTSRPTGSEASTDTSTPTPTNSATATASPTPSPTDSPTLSPTDSPTPVPEQTSATEQGGTAGGMDLLPIVAGLLGLGGGGAWLFARRGRGSDEEAPSGGGPDGGPDPPRPGDGGSSPGQSDGGANFAETASSGEEQTGQTERTDVDDAPQPEDVPTGGRSTLGEITERVEAADDLREEADDYRASGEYDVALERYESAREAYQSAREMATESDVDLLSIDKLDGKLDAVTRERKETHRQRLQERIDSVRSELERAQNALDSGDSLDDTDALESLASRLDGLSDSAAEHGFDELNDEISSVRALCSELRSRVADRPKDTGVPDSIPSAPDVSLDYADLKDEQPIGRGGNADVVQGTVPTSEGDLILAVKKPRISGTIHTETVERLMNEAETWAKLDDHDHIVDVVDYGSEPIPWIAMEYMDGGHLGERAGQTDTPQALWTAIAVTKGVRHAHRHGVAHLDLKPENILFRTVEDAWDVPKVADWGLSKHLLDHSKSIEGYTPTYSAPEQLDSEYGSADEITDVYQLGAVFYEFFTGQPPFRGDSTGQIVRQVLVEEPTPASEIADVPEALDEILLTALAKDKVDRYESVLLLRNALQDVYDE